MTNWENYLKHMSDKELRSLVFKILKYLKYQQGKRLLKKHAAHEWTILQRKNMKSQ